MAINEIRTGWLPLFQQSRTPNMFLSRFFTPKAGSFYRGDKIALDIERDSEDVAVAIQKATGANLNDVTSFTTKEFKPPAYGEAFPVDVNELISRMAGVDPFTDAYNEYATSLMAILTRGFRIVDDKIKRAVEVQAAQILQTGMLELKDHKAKTVYKLDFQPKATHFTGVTKIWSDKTGSPLEDIERLTNEIRVDGKVDPNVLIMGSNALNNFLKNTAVTELLDNRRIEIGRIDPRFENSGATFYGYIWIGAYRYDIYAYPNVHKSYNADGTTTSASYLDKDKVVVISTNTRLDMTSAEVPRPIAPDPRVGGLAPTRMNSREDGFDVMPNIYTTPNGKQIMGELESRPLLIPVQIDGFGCLTTNVVKKS